MLWRTAAGQEERRSHNDAIQVLLAFEKYLFLEALVLERNRKIKGFPALITKPQRMMLTSEQRAYTYSFSMVHSHGIVIKYLICADYRQTILPDRIEIASRAAIQPAVPPL